MASADSSKKLIGIVAVLYLFSPAPLFVQAQHPSCTFQSGMSVSCYQRGYILPTNFNTSSIPGQENIQTVTIGGTGNLGHDNPGVALPYLPKLISVYLDNFNENAHWPFPLNTFLTNNKAQLQLSGLDWALLEPLAGTLKDLKLHANALETEKLVNSLEFKLTAVEKIDLSGNRLTTLSPAVLDTLTHVAGSRLSMAIGENRFCGKRPAGGTPSTRTPSTRTPSTRTPPSRIRSHLVPS